MLRLKFTRAGSIWFSALFGSSDQGIMGKDLVHLLKKKDNGDNGGKTKAVKKDGPPQMNLVRVFFHKYLRNFPSPHPTCIYKL